MTSHASSSHCKKEKSNNRANLHYGKIKHQKLMLVAIRREGQDLKMLVIAISQFLVSTFNKNLTFLIYVYVDTCSNFTNFSKDSINASN